MSLQQFSRDIEVRHSVDVCVLGGGSAGTAAAVTAARQGRKVLLIEGQGCFGGMGTSGGLRAFCSFTNGAEFLADGFGRDLYHRLRDAGGITGGSGSFAMAPKLEGYFDTPFFDGEVLKRVLDDMVVESGADFSLFTQFIAVEAQEGRVQSVICAGKSGIFAVRADLFIDCTGDGDLCAWAGAPFEKGDNDGSMMPPTLCSLWADVDWEKAHASGFGEWTEEKHLPRAFADKVFTIEDPHLPGMMPVGKHLGAGNIGHIFGVDGTDERSLTRAMICGRKLMLEYQPFYKKYLIGYEHIQLAATSPLLGVRETRRILGDYYMVADDFLRRAVFEDEIGRFAYAVDIHASKPSEDTFTEFMDIFRDFRYQAGESYGIPYRCLIPQRLDNVLMAGRCISADRHMIGSLRVMPCCFLTGQAAGMAAALASEQHATPREVKHAELQTRLKAIGAYLPNSQVDVEE